MEKQKEMSERWVEWVEPFGPGPDTVYSRVTESAAIRRQRFVGETVGKPYTSDERALEDFMTVHWAEFVKV